MSCRLATELNAANTVIAAYTYDNNGNLKTQTQKYDAVTTNDAITRFDYDPLNRLTKITNALAGITQYGYDRVDHLVSVTDPKTLITGYGVDGLDNQKQLVSPDTGTTNSTYDAAGNLKTRTDARAKISTYSYDALNRLTGVTFSDTTPAIAYFYDDIASGNAGKGRLTKLTDATGLTEYTYDIQGRLLQKKQTTGAGVNLKVHTTSYSYNAGNGRLDSLTYPSAKVVGYTYDAQGRIASITVNGITLVSSISYQPFGPATSWLWSGGPLQTRPYDLDGRQTSYPYTGAGTVSLTYDLGNRIKNLSGTVTKAYGYDGPRPPGKLDRLTSSSNELYGYDAAGNILTTGSGFTFSYDARGRMTNITTASVNQYGIKPRAATSGINALGQRLTKAGTGRHVTIRLRRRRGAGLGPQAARRIQQRRNTYPRARLLARHADRRDQEQWRVCGAGGSPEYPASDLTGEQWRETTPYPSGSWHAQIPKNKSPALLRFLKLPSCSRI